MTLEFKVHPDQRTSVIFQFLYYPEYISVGNKIVVNTDNFKAFGVIKQIYPDKIDTSAGIVEKEIPKRVCLKERG